MAFDAHKNLAVASVVTPPAPATSGVTLVVGGGQGARFPAVPFNATVWPIDMAPDPSTAEVVRVTARTTDTLTITRAQEGTTARTIVAGDFIAATITAKTITDLEAGTNFPLLTTGAINGTTGTLTGALTVTGAITSNVNLNSGHTLGVSNASTGAGAYAVVSVASGPVLGALYSFSGGYASSGVNQAGGVTVYAGDAGGLSLAADHAAGGVRFYAGGQVERGRISATGGFSWGGTTDPGAGNLMLGASLGVGTAYTWLSPGAMASSVVGSASATQWTFRNATGDVGSITTSGSATAYNTTSDARLKTSLSRHTDTDVLRNTVIHNFRWKADGQPGRGVFAQEAQAVAPFAVSVGTDERDDAGRLKNPWGVDYSKYVPDLITGWQHHDARLAALEAAMHRPPVADLGMSEPARLRAKRPSALTASSFWLALTAFVHRIFTP